MIYTRKSNSNLPQKNEEKDDKTIFFIIKNPIQVQYPALYIWNIHYTHNDIKL